MHIKILKYWFLLLHELSSSIQFHLELLKFSYLDGDVWLEFKVHSAHGYHK